MGNFGKRAGHTLATGVLVLTGAGFLMLAGTGTANARPVSTTTCRNITTTLQSLNSRLSTTHSTLKASAALISRELTQAASTGSPQVKSAVHTFVTDLVAGADADDLDSAKLNADANAIVAACATANTPDGAPATGGGSSAGLQDPALFGLGGAAVLAGVVVLGLALRNRLRTRVSHG
jgi:hypothetical protein